MSDRVKDISVIVLFMTVVFGVFIINIFKPITKISVSERRKLALFPEITWDSLTRKKIKSTDKDTFTESFEKYTLDQFIWRDEFRQLKAKIAFDVFLQKDNNCIYMVDGQVSKYWNELNAGAVKNAAIKFNKIYNKHLKNMNVYYSIIPDKNYYMAAQNGYPSIDYNKFVGIIKANTNKNMQYIDLFGELNVDDYYATDIHWRQEKIIKIAQKYAKVLGFEISGKYEQVVKEPFYGTYYGQSALPISGEKLIYLTNDILDNCKISQVKINTIKLPVKKITNFVKKRINKDLKLPKTTETAFTFEEAKFYREEFFENVDPYDLFLEGTQKPLIIIENDNATTEKELIIYRDSFGSSLAPLLAEGYKKITVVDVRYMSTAILDANNLIEYKDGQDVLFVFSTDVLHNSSILLVD